MNEFIFIQFAFYLLSIFALIKIFLNEIEDIILKFKRLKEKIKRNAPKP